MRAAAAKAVEWQRGKAAEEDTAARDALVECGMQFDPLSPEVRAELQDRTAGVVDELRVKIGGAIIDVVLAEAGS